MRWQDRERSENVEDRRGTGARPSGGRRMAVGGGMGIGGLLILIVLAFLSKDPAKFLQDILPAVGFHVTAQHDAGFAEDDQQRHRNPIVTGLRKWINESILGVETSLELLFVSLCLTR